MTVVYLTERYAPTPFILRVQAPADEHCPSRAFQSTPIVRSEGEFELCMSPLDLNQKYIHCVNRDDTLILSFAQCVGIGIEVPGK